MINRRMDDKSLTPVSLAVSVAAEYAEAICCSDGDRMAACRSEGYELDFVHRDASGGEPLAEGEAREFWSAWFQAFPEMDFQVTRTIAAEEIIVMQWIFTAVNDGPIIPPIAETTVPATGKPIRFRGVSIFDLKDGLIEHESMYVDFATFWAELGVTP